MRTTVSQCRTAMGRQGRVAMEVDAGKRRRERMVVSYNGMNMKEEGRQTNVHNELKKAMFIGLQGTRRRQEENGLGYSTWREEGFVVVSSGHSNRDVEDTHAGVSISVNLGDFSEKNIKAVWAPRTDKLAGRVLAVRVVDGDSDTTVIDSYFPSGAQRDPNKRTQYIAVAKAIGGFIEKLPKRTSVIMLTDANAHVGYKAELGAAGRNEGEAIGIQEQEIQDFPGDILEKLLDSNNLSAYNTHWQSGKTYYGTRGERTRPDYVCEPMHWMNEGRITYTKVLETTGKRLQYIKCTKGRADHYPIAAWIKIELPYRETKRTPGWDWERLADAAKKGSDEGERMRERIGERVEREYERHGTTTARYDVIEKLVCEEARNEFTKVSKKKGGEDFRKERIEMLQSRGKANSKQIDTFNKGKGRAKEDHDTDKGRVWWTIGNWLRRYCKRAKDKTEPCAFSFSPKHIGLLFSFVLLVPSRGGGRAPSHRFVSSLCGAGAPRGMGGREVLRLTGNLATALSFLRTSPVAGCHLGGGTRRGPCPAGHGKGGKFRGTVVNKPGRLPGKDDPH